MFDNGACPVILKDALVELLKRIGCVCPVSRLRKERDRVTKLNGR